MLLYKISNSISNIFFSFISIFSLKLALYSKDCYSNLSTLKIRGRVNFLISNPSNVYIGRNVRINNSYFNNPIGRQTNSLIVVRRNAVLVIGDNVGISSSYIVCNKDIRIGSNTLIGGDVCIYDSDFHSLDVSKRNTSLDRQFTMCKPINIGSNVFIGAHSIILKGVTIGDNSIIGAGSVVAKNVPANQIWAGNPAVYIRMIK